MNETIPHEVEAEQAVLGSVIEDNDLLIDILPILKPSNFYRQSHQHIFRTMAELGSEGSPIDEVIIGDRLRNHNQLDEVGGYAYLAELIDCVPSSGNIVYYARIIQEAAAFRDFICSMNELSRKARDPEQGLTSLLIEAETEISKLSSNIENKKVVKIKDVLACAFKELEKRSNSDSQTVGLSTGFIDLDKKMNGLIPPDLITIAGRPGMGKTAFALNIASYVATRSDDDGAVLVFSREMSNLQLAFRMLSSEGKISGDSIKTGNLEEEDWNNLAMATEKLSSAEIFFDEVSSNIEQVVFEAKALHKRHKKGIKLIIVDYLQLLKGLKKDNREQEVADMSRSLKNLAKELNIPIIQLSQLNRKVDDRSDKRPVLSDLRESGAIEQDSDIIIFIYRDEVYFENSPDKGIAELIISKHRNGSTGVSRVAFQGKYAKFANLSYQHI